MSDEFQGVRPGERIEDVDVSSEMDSSFLEYAMSVIVARALPDVRDGLKPVHRRILYTMFSSGMRPDGPYKKSARTVGSVIGKFHPHGDSAVYEAMVRLAQSWSMRLPLVDGHGNFGSLDDGPAAMRYTEARLASAAMLMLEELGEETVDFVPNYDGTESEPSVLPSLIPNLLVNGSTGIAVGMATNMPPHNLGEVLQLLKRLLEDPSVSDEELLRLLPGPDFPSGGSVLLGDGYRSAFLTGQGTVTLRARTEIAETGRRRQGIVVTELPYTVGPEKVIARIKELSASKRLQGVADVKDFSDRRTGMRLVIECKSGFAPERLLEELFRLTPLQENFSINNVALVDGTPRTLGVRQMAELFLAHRREVVTRRSRFRLTRAEERAHIVEGLLTALSALDQVIAIVRASKDTDQARKELMGRLQLTRPQADAVLEMTIRRLTGLERDRLEKELKQLEREVTSLRKLLASPRLLDRLIGEELDELGQQHASPRSSILLAEAPPALSGPDPDLVVSDEPCRLLLSPSGMLLRTAPDAPSVPAVSSLSTTIASPVGLLFSDGMLLRMPAADVLPDAGSSAAALVPGSAVPVGLLDLRPGRRCLLVTASGLVKAFVADVLPQRGDLRSVVRLDDLDRVVAAFPDPGSAEAPSRLMLVSSQGRGLVFPAAQVTAKGLAAGGMAGMRLSDGALVIAAGLLHASLPAGSCALVTSAGRVKVLNVEEVPAKGRGTGGVMLLNFRKGEDGLASAFVSAGEPVPLSARNVPVKLRLDHSSRSASASEPSKPVSSFCSDL